MKANKKQSVDDFWREYEATIGEKVLARSLGQYVSGWEEFDHSSRHSPLWGLIMATSGGFRFHHFPQTNWISALAQYGSSGKAPKEKTIFIPGDSILSAVYHQETKWYNKIFFPIPPRLIIRYRDTGGTEKELLLYAERQPEAIAEQLTKIPFGVSE